MNVAFQIIQLTHRYLKSQRANNVISPEIRSAWATEVISLLNFEVSTRGTAQANGTVIFVSNHISYVDIPILMMTFPDCVFLSKKEISYWPIFGSAAKKLGTIFVNRNSRLSRSRAKEAIEDQLSRKMIKLVVFPSGTTSLSNEKLWKKGIFEIAKKMGIMIQPIRINYSNLRKVAYIDNDFFPYHLVQLVKEKGIKVEIEIHKPILIQDVISDLNYCRTWCSAESVVI
jgi:1-acyl-sn-glycerol-3-phosphate acyltransferase